MLAAAGLLASADRTAVAQQDFTGVKPHCYFECSEGSPVNHLVH